jgi:integrase
MPRKSATDNVRKVCGCVKWKECAHPWYVWYREGKELGPNGKLRARRLRRKLAELVGREPVDFADAKTEARRAIVAWQDGRDARELLAEDAPTLAAVLDAYGHRPNGSPIDRFQRGPILKTMVNGRPFGEWRATDITLEMIKAFQRQRPKIAGNRDLACLRAMFNWAILEGLVPRQTRTADGRYEGGSPFRVGDVPAVKLAAEASRTRRLQPGEDERLLLHAKGLRDLLIAALETGCRLGELLSLQWEQVRGELFLPAGKTKAKKPRRVPISSVLRAVLDARRLDPAGDPLSPDAFVFGDEIGRRRHSIKTAWRLTCQRAQIVGLHFHDLRREAGSRWMDAGVPIAMIQRWLGHHNISQTSTYLAASGGGDADAMRAFEQAAGRLPHVAPPAGSTGSDPARTDHEGAEKSEETVTVH